MEGGNTQEILIDDSLGGVFLPEALRVSPFALDQTSGSCTRFAQLDVAKID